MLRNKKFFFLYINTELYFSADLNFSFVIPVYVLLLLLWPGRETPPRYQREVAHVRQKDVQPTPHHTRQHLLHRGGQRGRTRTHTHARTTVQGTSQTKRKKEGDREGERGCVGRRELRISVF